MGRIAIIIGVLGILLSLPALADYHYASHDGTNEYPYNSWETGAHLIQDAVDATSPHDTVYIGAGEWYETVATGVYDSIGIIGMGMDSTFLYSDEYRTPVLTIDYNCSVEGLMIQHTDNWQCLWARPYAGVKISNCKFMNTGFGVMASGSNTTITDCIFDSCGRAIYSGNFAGHYEISNNLILRNYSNAAIDLACESVVIENNIFLNSAVYVINCTFASGVGLVKNNFIHRASGGIYVRFVNAYNNTVEYTGYGNRKGIQAGYPDSIVNNSVSECGNSVSVSDSFVFNYNNLWHNEVDPSFNNFINPVGNISVDPMYVSEANAHLQAFSPLIDAGDPNILDVDGSRSDIGCYGGPSGCSYVYLDLAPMIPDSIIATVDSLGVALTWHSNTEADFNRYQIFKDTTAGFEPSIFDMIAEPETSFYHDADIDPETAYYYKLTSVDNQGNVSEYSAEVAIIPTHTPSFFDDGLPKQTTISCAYPNPSNANITIVYSASNLGPQPPQGKLQIYDIQGRVVKTLVDGRIPAGTYRAMWDGTNDRGESVASGTYIARVSQWGADSDFPVKITLLK